MDFAFSPDQEALRDLAKQICQDHVTQDRLKAIEQTPDWFDRDLWGALAKASLLGLALPEEYGGVGLGLVELCLVLEQVGGTVAPVPVWATALLGAAPIAAFGTAEQKAKWLPGVVSGDVILTAALTEFPAEDPAAPETRAVRDGDGWRLEGVKQCVPAAHLAARVLVPARTGDGTIGVFLIDPQAQGVTLERQIATNKEPLSRMTLTGAIADDVLGDPMAGTAIVEWLVDHATVGLCALELGVVDRALRMTAQYTIERKQFDRAIASFQAVQQRAADAFIDVEGIRLTLWQAAWLLDEGRPAHAEVLSAKFWAADAGHRIAYTAQHLHGGIGVDTDYPLYRYYLWSKAIELTMGSGARQLARLGELIAAGA
ncbi:MAG TPA: acyl-CoA dehydrogenase family protein [Candidatus Binatia bacterium]|jgi:alkylation response protein AidB-like acyl-CoA dehydrogenase|nr:acyl-CoA dehydrogenase family protein [Candidatus Binatia bacterium]